LFLLLGICFSLSDENLDFSLDSTAGKTYRLSELKGRLVYLNFFSEHCYPCEREVPILNQMSRLEPELLLVLGVGYNYSSKERLARSKKRMGIEFPVLFDSQNYLAKKLGVFALPSGFLIDEQGRIKLQLLGEQGARLIKVVAQELSRRRKELVGRKIYLSKFEPINSLPQGLMVNLRTAFRNYFFARNYWLTTSPEKADYQLEVRFGKWLEIVEFDFLLCSRSKKRCCYQGRIQTLGFDLDRYFQEVEKALRQISGENFCKKF